MLNEYLKLDPMDEESVDGENETDLGGDEDVEDEDMDDEATDDEAVDDEDMDDEATEEEDEA